MCFGLRRHSKTGGWLRLESSGDAQPVDLGCPALASTLVMMDTFDVAAFAAGIVIVTAACLVAAFYPARRAAGVEPWLALRIE
jgi:ABC-type antimicrobial peptide transport system permease subunit